MIVVVEQESRLALQRVRLRDHLVARLRSSALDRALAAGVSPESSVALALHAGHLSTSTQRDAMAHTLARIELLATASHTTRVRTPLSRAAVRSCEAELQAVVERLAACGPVGVQGIARLRTLLSDGTGSLYGASPPGRLRHDLLAALEGLDAVA
jgi:hypothetical protein